MATDTVLVTGGAGYIGSHLVRQLLDRGVRVRVLERFLYGDQGLKDVRNEANLEVREGDICDVRAMTDAAQGTRCVIALAALVGDPACALDHDETMRVNFESTKVLLEACKAAKVQRTVFASSCSVYGANGDEILTEESWLNPVSLYAQTRIMSEELLAKERGDLEVAILRLSTVCGTSPRMRFDLMVNTITARAVLDGAIRVVGAQQWRPHIHVQDVATAFRMAALEAPSASAQASIYNVGGESQNFTVGEVAEKVVARFPETKVEYVDQIEDRRSYRVSFDRVRKGIGFVPQFTVDDAIEEIRVLLTGEPINVNADVYHNVKTLQRYLGMRASA